MAPCDPPANRRSEHGKFKCSKMYGWEYTRHEHVQLVDLPFSDDGEEGVPVERRKDAGCEDAGLLEKRGE